MWVQVKPSATGFRGILWQIERTDCWWCLQLHGNYKNHNWLGQEHWSYMVIIIICVVTLYAGYSCHNQTSSDCPVTHSTSNSTSLHALSGSILRLAATAAAIPLHYQLWICSRHTNAKYVTSTLKLLSHGWQMEVYVANWTTTSQRKRAIRNTL